MQQEDDKLNGIKCPRGEIVAWTFHQIKTETMNTKKVVFFCITLFVSCLTVQARMPVPEWARNVPQAPHGANFVYVVGVGIGNDRTAAFDRAVDEAFINALRRQGSLEFDGQTITEGQLLRGEIMANRLPHHVQCQTPTPIRLANGQVQIYVLVQVPVRGGGNIPDPSRTVCESQRFDRDLRAWNYGDHDFSARVFVPGMAQIYKGRTGKGVMFITLQAATVGGIIVSEAMRATAIANRNTARTPTDIQFYNNRATDMQNMRDVFIGGAIAVYVWNVIDGIVARGRPGYRRGGRALSFTPYVAPQPGSNLASGISLTLNF